MSIKSISWILEFTSKLPDEEKVKCLQANGVEPMKIVLRYALDPKIKWLLPPGNPPWEPCQDSNLEGGLYRETRNLHHFIEGGNDDLHPLRREALFIRILERLDPEDAKLLVSVKDKVIPYEGITLDIVNQAFPGLIQ